MVDEEIKASGDALDASADAENEIDVDALRTAIGTASEQAAITQELANLKRQAGHVPALQKRFDAVEQRLSRLDGLEASSKALQERVDALINAFPDGLIPERAIAGLRPTTDPNASVLAKLEALEARMSGDKAQDEQYEDPSITARKAELAAAQNSVNAYAQAKGFDPTTVPDAVYGRALSANGNDTVAAALDVMKYIDSQIAAQGRRGERKDAGAGGNASRSSRQGAVTLEQISKMSVEEVLKIPAAEREAAMKAAN